jgi:hypothetical protein
VDASDFRLLIQIVCVGSTSTYAMSTVGIASSVLIAPPDPLTLTVLYKQASKQSILVYSLAFLSLASTKFHPDSPRRAFLLNTLAM